MFELNINEVEIPVVDNCKFLGVWIDKSLNWKKHVSTLQLKIKCKFLGVWIDKSLNWKKHVSTLQLKIKRNMHLLQTCKNFLDVRSRRMIYNADIQSHVVYSLSTWGNMVNNQQIMSINKLMQKCIKIIDKTGTLDRSVLNLNNLIMLENYKFGFKLVKNLLPPKIIECAKTGQKGVLLIKKHKYSTRLNSVPNLPKASTTKYSNSIFCSGLRNYSKLPTEIRLCNLYNVFISKCKQLF